MKAEKERFGTLSLQETNGALRKELREIAFFLGGLLVFIEIEGPGGILVREVVGGAAIDAKKLIKAMPIGAELL